MDDIIALIRWMGVAKTRIKMVQVTYICSLKPLPTVTKEVAPLTINVLQ
jgi:hypothetical protein